MYNWRLREVDIFRANHFYWICTCTLCWQCDLSWFFPSTLMRFNLDTAALSWAGKIILVSGQIYTPLFSLGQICWSPLLKDVCLVWIHLWSSAEIPFPFSVMSFWSVNTVLGEVLMPYTAVKPALSLYLPLTRPRIVFALAIEIYR